MWHLKQYTHKPATASGHTAISTAGSSAGPDAHPAVATATATAAAAAAATTKVPTFAGATGATANDSSGSDGGGGGAGDSAAAAAADTTSLLVLTLIAAKYCFQSWTGQFGGGVVGGGMPRRAGQWLFNTNKTLSPKSDII